jgi:hypothetical protein
VGIIVDHFSRRIMGFTVFTQNPTSAVVVQRVFTFSTCPPERELDNHRQPERWRMREEENSAAPDAGVFLP